jgi:hypothetical protein
MRCITIKGLSGRRNLLVVQHLSVVLAVFNYLLCEIFEIIVGKLFDFGLTGQGFDDFGTSFEWNV